MAELPSRYVLPRMVPVRFLTGHPERETNTNPATESTRHIIERGGLWISPYMHNCSGRWTMLNANDLEEAFNTYWDDMARCRTAKAYWSLLHVTVCLPDICAALQSNDGGAKRAHYRQWCGRWMPNPKLPPEDRYCMRCKVLHEGSSRGCGQHPGFIFGQPASTGQVDHLNVHATGKITIDVGELAEDTKIGVTKWVDWLRTNPTSNDAQNVAKNFPSLVHVTIEPVFVQEAGVKGVLISRQIKTH